MAALPLASSGIARSISREQTATTLSTAELHRLRAGADSASLLKNEAFWQQVRSCYALPEGVIQLENGNWGAMGKPVLQTYLQQTERVNQLTSYYSRREFAGEVRPIVADLAARLGCAPDELALARGASEVLNNLISGYRLLEPNQAVMYADIDYDSMQAAMRQRGVAVVQLNIPEGLSAEEIVAFYRDALQRNPQVKLLLLTHLSHRHGLVLPIKAIVRMAREFGVDCIVDAAHSWGQMDFNLADLGADFVGFNIHKWMGAPIGCGLMYIKRSRLADIAPALGDSLDFSPPDTVGKTYHRIHTGTFNYAAWLSIPSALAFHDAIGGKLKAARIRYLRNYWVERVRSLPFVDIVADRGDNAQFAGITSLRLNSQTGKQANRELAAVLLQNHNLFTVLRTGLQRGACVRVTPSVFNTTAELDVLVEAINAGGP